MGSARSTGSARAAYAGLLVAAAVLAALWLALRGTPGDYPDDAAPAVDALLRGDIDGFFANQPLMGALSLLVRAPFAGLADLLGGGAEARYRWGVVPCALVLVAVVMHLTGELSRRHASVVAGALLVWACLFATAAEGAVLYGHPEEMLGGALAVAAVIASARGHTAWAGVALGAAIATKYWALVAIGPVLLAAAPAARRQLAVAGAIAAVVLTVPLFLGDPGRFTSILEQSRSTQGVNIGATNVWWPGHQTVTSRVFDGVEEREHTRYFAGEVAERFAHPLIVLLVIPLTLMAWRARRESLAEALGLLALLFLLRCALDPLTIDYYHVPFVVALAGWEAYTRRGLPLATMVSAAVLWLIYRDVIYEQSHWLTFALYMAWTVPMAAILAMATLRRSRAPSRTA